MTELKTIDRDTRLLQNAWFPYDRCQSFTIAGIAIVNCSATVAIIWKQFSFCQRSPAIPATAKDRWDRIRVYLRDRNDREGLSVHDRNDLMNNTRAAIAAIASITVIPAIIPKSKHKDCNDREDRSDRACPAISTIPTILWKPILSDRNDRQRSYEN